MSNTHRIAWIDAQIRGGRYPNAVTIADKFSISPRQASRDLEYLRDTMCAPLAYSYQRKGYYYEGRSFVVANLVMTEEQRKTIAYLAEQYKRMENEHATHLARLFSRLVGDAEEEEPTAAIPIFPVERSLLSRFDVLSDAIRERRKVRIRYGAKCDDAVEALLSPYKIYVYRKDNYVAGYCEPDKEIRLFRLAELWDASPTDHRYDLAPLLGKAEIVPYLTDEADIAVVRFHATPYGKWLGLRAEEIVPGTYRIHYLDKDQLLAKLFACPSGFEIVSPRWLGNLAANRLRRMVGRVGSFSSERNERT
ncbi:WYL domain-containing protein [Paenibacillus mesophilus]|uniref:helix-turn-helix transcriptional regulator n=1 Tax=Paenibacillus mesophilus TaxID=2582849 RepID=UPI00110ECB93|nr:WYL domain-containing protein [Paenibacillus mesophilus]TMV50092.1 WYL domain-containing protein [Paenibacillus mesophilus]